MNAAYPVRLPLSLVVRAQERFAGAVVADDVPLAPLTTLRVGPIARRVITCSTGDQVIAVLRGLEGEPPGPVLVLAGGSNVVIADHLTDLTVVRLANSRIRVDGTMLTAEAGAVWDDVVAAALRRGLGGLECLSGIPGSAGATPVQNVGAYGVEVADRLRRVRLLDRRDGQVRWVGADTLGFGYRHSLLRNSADTVVLEVQFELFGDGLSAPLRYRELCTELDAEGGARADPGRVREAVLVLRRRKGMVLDGSDHDTWSVGSFFVNPIVTTEQFAGLRARFGGPVPHWPASGGAKLAAGWLVEQAGFSKGFPGENAPARLSTKHALAVTNRGTATAADVAALARTVRDGVFAAFGITLAPEPVLVGVTI
ncbi:MAG TPA: UDP-N-acetylmuramate dehydrogenase [Mycobacterium sp.]|nr:UDP-N-acetylmuramate dehydrogenase [Mycobacterium sp.]